MHAFHVLSDLGEVFIPAQFRELASDDAPLRHFTDSDLAQLDRIFTHLRRGGVAVLSGKWDRIVEVLDYAERKKKELVPRLEKPKRRRDFNSRDRRPKPNESVSAMSRLMCYADGAGNLQIDPPPNLPYLLELVGEIRARTTSVHFYCRLQPFRNSRRRFLKNTRFPPSAPR